MINIHLFFFFYGSISKDGRGTLDFYLQTAMEELKAM